MEEYLGVVREDPKGKFGNYVAEFLGDGFGVFGFNQREKKQFERGLCGWRETRPKVRFVTRELFGDIEEHLTWERWLLEDGKEKVGKKFSVEGSLITMFIQYI